MWSTRIRSYVYAHMLYAHMAKFVQVLYVHHSHMRVHKLIHMYAHMRTNCMSHVQMSHVLLEKKILML